MPISEATHLRVIEEDPERKWELHCGELHEKPPSDAEFWLIHRVERIVRIHYRRADGSYAETVRAGGIVRLSALPDVTTDLDALSRRCETA